MIQTFPLFKILMIGVATSGMLMGAACAPTADGRAPAPLAFTHMAPFQVNAGHVEVINRYDHTINPQDISASLPTPPDVALTRYARSRLQAQGFEGTLQFIIEDASVTSQIEEPESAMLGWMRMGVQDRYDALVNLRLIMVGADGRERSEGTVRLRRYITVPQSHSIARREQALSDMVRELMDDVDDAVTGTLRNQMRL